jgi:iron-sulfur cluster insertion protein
MGRAYSRSAVAGVFAASVLFGCQGCLPSDAGNSPPPVVAPRGQPVFKLKDPPAVTVTPKAAAKIREYTVDQPEGGKVHLRIRVVPGGCQGFMQKLDLDPEVTTADQVWESEGVSVVVFKRQLDMLRGALVDFVDEDGKQGFKVENPNFKGEWMAKWQAALEGERDIK